MDTSNIDSLWESVCNAQDASDYDQAASLMEGLLALTGDSAELWTLYGSFCVELERWADAEGAYRQALLLNPHSVSTHTALGELFFVQRQWDLAEPHLATAVELDENDAQANIYLGRVLYLMGKTAEAERRLQHAICVHKDKNNEDAYLFLGDALKQLGRREEAAKAYNKAIDINPRCGARSALQQLE